MIIFSFKAASILQLSLMALLICRLPLHAVPDIDITASVTDLENFCGTSRVKIVFTTNGDSLYFVDFTESSQPRIQTTHQVSDPAVPVLSPGGHWIAYATISDLDARS
ncbi:MAG: hypothetical protein GF350_08030, partial [Chitinivibrionales bacterium]|nr:hypothetical protein [Chitinivibrionales bacterium]